ncbi:MAG: C40 family peptidase [Parabacteroides sp.]
MVKRTFFLFTALFGLLLVSFACASHKQERVALPADFKGPKALEKIYGVRITADDNIYLYNEGARWLGVSHRTGGLTKRGVDCSGLVTNIYREVYGKQLSRSSADMLKHDCRKVARDKLKEGDLLFFRTAKSKRGVPTHVGIYLKNGKFIHASTTKGVIVSSLGEPYYQRTWLCGGRVR